MINGKIAFLLLLVATCVALSHAGLWMEWRNRAVAVIRLVSRIRPLRRFNAEQSLGHVEWLVNDRSDGRPLWP
jgi:hypothetical protein